jgi:hypothetical protein
MQYVIIKYIRVKLDKENDKNNIWGYHLQSAPKTTIPEPQSSKNWFRLVKNWSSSPRNENLNLLVRIKFLN